MKYTSITIALLLTAAGAIKLDQKDAVVQSTTALSPIGHDDGADHEHHESEDEADDKDHASDDEGEKSEDEEEENFEL